KSRMSNAIKYARNVVIRNTLRYLARGLFLLLSQTQITGLHKFPRHVPLIVVGNHTGAMEVVLMATYAPRAMEFMGAMEMHWNGWMGSIIDLYALIPVYRGYTSTETMKQAVSVLEQDGMLGIFPEGG